MSTPVLDATPGTAPAPTRLRHLHRHWFHPRQAPWRSPHDQPGHARPLLLAIAALATVLYTWRIDQSHYHPYYADAARSMTQSWKAFVFGSFDPANTITMDKLPGFLWPQALSARIFGFHPWALTLPQVIEGVLAVLVLYRVVRRWAGANAGLLAATAFTLTPVVAGLFRTAVEDPVFTLLLLLAADATQRAARDARLRPLLLAGFWVGLAFQAKMLEAWAVLPALGATYLLAAPTALRRRWAHVALAGVVTAAVSLSWILLVSVVPAQDRPYVDGTTNNSALSMVVGYNFLNRFSSVGLTAGGTGSVSAVQRGPGGASSQQDSRERSGVGADSTGTQSQRHSPGREQAASPSGVRAYGGGPGSDGGWSKMFGSQFASQTGWLYPPAALAAFCALIWRRREPRTDALRAGFVLWGTWLAVFFLVFSAGSVGGHSYYMGVIAAALAALSGAGTILLWRAFRTGGRRAWALPTAIAATVAWSSVLAWRFPSFLPWLAPATITGGLVALALLGWARLGRPARPRLARAGLLAGIAAMLLAPAAWAASVLDPAYGNPGMGTVGPAGQRFAPPWASQPGPGEETWNPFGDSSPRLTAQQQALYDYLQAHRGATRYLFAASSWNGASPYLLATGQEVLPMGGFSGQVPSPSPAQFHLLVTQGMLRYVLVGGAGGESGSGGPTAGILAWVRSTCAVVPPDRYGASETGSGLATGADMAATQQLYDCATTH